MLHGLLYRGRNLSFHLHRVSSQLQGPNLLLQGEEGERRIGGAGEGSRQALQWEGWLGGSRQQETVR